MCDPVSMLVGAVGGMAVSSAMAPSAPRVAKADPEKERAEAEAKAAQLANAKLAEDQKRRRAQGSLLARGGGAQATGPSLGDADISLDSPLSAVASTARRGAAMISSRSSTAQNSSMLSRGRTYTTERTPARPSRASAG